jgi:Flp pilus assembly pilin Flp
MVSKRPNPRTAAPAIAGDGEHVPPSDRERVNRGLRAVRRRSRRRSPGSASVEYGLIVALIGAVLCVGIGITVKTVFEHAIYCFTVGMQGGSDPSCDDSGGVPSGPGDPGDTGNSGDPGGPLPVPTDTSTPSPSPSPSESPTPSPTTP